MNIQLDGRNIKIIAISGSGRTGSTLLSLLLSQHHDVFNLGQLRDLWKSYQNNELCSCGHRLQQCEVYSRVIQHVFGTDAIAGLNEMQVLMKTFFADAKSQSSWNDASILSGLALRNHAFLRKLHQVLDEIRLVTGVRFFVDASKSPEMALAFSLTQGTDLLVLNLCRDPRAVACSWFTKLKSIRASMRYVRMWLNRQRVLERWAVQLKRKYIFVRYENFAKRPKSTVGEIARWAGLELPRDLFVSSNQAVLSWAGLHLYPPANERILSERKCEVTISITHYWRRRGLLIIRILALLYSYPIGYRYIIGETR
jgi:hypothetical protein